VAKRRGKFVGHEQQKKKLGKETKINNQKGKMEDGMRGDKKAGKKKGGIEKPAKGGGEGSRLEVVKGNLLKRQNSPQKGFLTKSPVGEGGQTQGPYINRGEAKEGGTRSSNHTGRGVCQKTRGRKNRDKSARNKGSL